MATMAFTSSGRASAMSQPKVPDCEWVKRIAGPILSSKAAPASRLSSCWRGKLASEGKFWAKN